MKKNKKEILLLSILIILFSIIIAPKTFQNDTFFTIACGQRLLTYGIEEYDKLTWHENLKFTNARYVFDIIIATLYNFAGFFGVYCFVIFLTIMIGLVFYHLLIKRNIHYLFSFFCTIYIMYIGCGILAARAQIISILLFIIESYCIEKLLETNYKRYWISLLIIPIVLANTHASIFPVYFIFFLPYIAEAILFKIPFIKKDGDKIYIQKRKHIKSLICVMFLGVLGGFCTPLGFVPYTSMFLESGGISSEIISELQPLVPVYAVNFMFINIIFIAVLSFTKAKINISDLFLFLGLDLMAISTARTNFYFIFIGYIVVIKLLNTLLKENNIYSFVISRKTKTIFYAIISIIFVFVCTNSITKNMRKDYVDIEEYPVDAAEYILHNIDVENMKIYNGFNFGSYLEFKGIKSFMDSRSGMLCEEFNEGVTILKDYSKLTSGSVHYNEIFEKYGITHVLLYPSEIVNVYIQNDLNWECIYQDDSFVLYERK